MAEKAKTLQKKIRQSMKVLITVLIKATFIIHVSYSLMKKILNQKIRQMKKLILAGALFLSVSSFSYAHNGDASYSINVKSGGRDIPASEVPTAVKRSFHHRFPDATRVQWEIEREDGMRVYEAEFTLNGVRYKAEFAPDGTFLGRERA
jgi:hypothetical protein